MIRGVQLLWRTSCLLAVGCQSSFSELDLFLLAEMQKADTAPLDETNQWDGHTQAISFGEQLFFSTALSPDNITCATCHHPDLGFTDGQPQATGIGVTPRHSPTLFDMAEHSWFRWDGGCDSLWCQAIGPIESPVEMNSSRTYLAYALGQDAELRGQYESLFGVLPDVSTLPLIAKPTSDDTEANDAWNTLSANQQHEITQVLVNTTKSIAAFEATIQSQDTVFDQFLVGLLDPNTSESEALALLTEEEEHGLRLFIGEGGCHFCHNGPTLSNDAFHNIGLGTRDWLEPTDIGRYDGITMLQTSTFNASGEWSDDPNGARAERIDRLVQNTEQLGQFKTPSLRNLLQTAPYMHGGHFETLEEVVNHYSKLEESSVQGHSDETLKPLNWTDEQQQAMIAFLRTLDDSL